MAVEGPWNSPNKFGNETEAKSSNLRSIYSDLIKMAAELVRGEGVPDWSERAFRSSTPKSERRDMMKALRDADEALRVYGIRLREIADKVSAEIGGAAETSVPPAGITWLTRGKPDFAHWRKDSNVPYDWCGCVSCNDARGAEKTGAES